MIRYQDSKKGTFYGKNTEKIKCPGHPQSELSDAQFNHTTRLMSSQKSIVTSSDQTTTPQRSSALLRNFPLPPNRTSCGAHENTR